EDRVRRVVGLPPGVEGTFRGFMFPGLHVFEPDIFGWMEPDAAYSVIRTTYVKLLAAGMSVYGFLTPARWVNIDTPRALAAADLTLRTAPFRFVNTPKQPLSRSRARCGAAARNRPSEARACAGMPQEAVSVFLTCTPRPSRRLLQRAMASGGSRKSRERTKVGAGIMIAGRGGCRRP